MKHTHEVRLHDYRKGLHHTETLHEGDAGTSLEYLRVIAKNAGCGVGLLTNNGGYSIIDLDKERIDRITLAAEALYEAAKQAASYLQTINCGDDGDQALQSLTAAIFKAENDPHPPINNLNPQNNDKN